MRPEIESSTREERFNYIKETFSCKGDCDVCGICAVFRGKEPLVVFSDYVDGKRTFEEIYEEYKK